MQLLLIVRYYLIFWYIYFEGGEGLLEFPDLWSGQNLMELIFNPCGEFRWSPEGPVSQIHSPHLLVRAPSRSYKVCSDAKERVGKLPHLSIPIKTQALVPEFALEDLPLSRTAVLVPEFAVKDLPLGRILWWLYIYIYIYIRCFRYLD